MRIWGTLAAVIIAACQATPPIASAADGSNEVRFKLYRDYAIIVRGSIGNLKNLNFLVDTGAVPSVLDGRIANQLGVETQDGQLSVLTKKLTTRHAIAPAVRLGPLQVQNLPVVVQDLAFAEDALGTRVDAMIGFDLLGRMPFTIDYRTRTIIFGPVDPSLATIPYRPDLPYVMVDLQVQQETIGIVVDTGASDLVLFESGTRDYRAAITTTKERTWSNMGGEIRVREAQLINAHLGTMPWGHRKAYVLESNGEQIPGVSGILGTKALKADRVAFDPTRKVVAWEMNATLATAEAREPDLILGPGYPDQAVEFDQVESTHSRPADAKVIVSVYNDAQVPHDILERALQQAARIFSTAGLDVKWLRCTHINIGVRATACNGFDVPGHVAVRIIDRGASSKSDAAFGVAFLAPDGTGRYSDVFWKRAQKLHANSKVDLCGILGSVIAHEMGHLLLGSNAHAISGIMRAHWESEELHRIAMGTLMFLPEQSERMHARIATSKALLVSGVRPD